MYGWRSRTRRSSTSDAGRKPRRPMSRMRPPFTTSITGPSTTPPESLICSIVAPGALVLGALLRQDESTLLVLFLEDQRLDLVAERDDLVRVDVVADRELADGDDALGLVADVEEHLVVVDLHDRALHDVAVVEGDDRLVDRVVEGERTEVVLGDLVEDVAVRRRRTVGGGCRRGCGAASVAGSLGPGRRSRAARRPVSAARSRRGWSRTSVGGL